MPSFALSHGASMTDLAISYGTSDGKKFDDRKEAEEHQFDLDFTPDRWWLPKDLRCEAQYDNHHHNAKQLSTHELAQLLIKHPDMPALTCEGFGIDCIITSARDGVVRAKFGETVGI